MTTPPTIKNPYPRDVQTADDEFDLGMTDVHFDDNHSTLLSHNPVFETDQAWFNGHPRQLLDVWRQIMEVVDEIEQEPKWESFRYTIREVVGLCHDITQAACLGLGAWRLRFVGETTSKEVGQARDTWCYQYAAFDLICRYIEQKEKKKISRIFQDPTFDFTTRYVIEVFGGGRVVDVGETERHVDTQTFLYAAHLPSKGFCGNVLNPDRHPQLYLGNRMDHPVGALWHIARSYIEHVYLSKQCEPTTEMEGLREQVRLFQDTHDHCGLGCPSLVVPCFDSMGIYYPKQEKVEDGANGGSAEGEVPTGEPSSGGKDSTPPAPGDPKGPTSGSLFSEGPESGGHAQGEGDADVTEAPDSDHGLDSSTSGTPVDAVHDAKTPSGSGDPKEWETGNPSPDSKRVSQVAPLRSRKTRAGGVGSTRSRFGGSHTKGSIKDGLKSGL